MTGADEGYFPRPEKRNPVFGDGSPNDPYFEQDDGQRHSTASPADGQQFAMGGQFPTGGQGAFDAPRQLNLGDDEVRLPWLEGDEEHEEEKSGISQGMLLGALGLMAVLLLGIGVFWVVQSQPDHELVADGGVIAAPKDPYKSKPENPGGEVVAGTGDTSFAIAEGQSRLPQIDGQAPAAPKGAAPQTQPSPAPAPSAASVPVNGVGVQIGAYASREKADAGWLTLKSQYEPLGNVGHRIVEGQADIGTVYRLQAVPGDAAAARTLCKGMKSVGLNCQVKN